jgi:drug/metabolite transporter (DMT)-like permease
LSPRELALVLLSALLHAVWSVSIKGSRDPLAFNVLQLATTLAGACALPWLVPLAAIPGPVWALVAGTGLAHGLYFYWLSRALGCADLSVVYPIARSAPAFMPLVAVPLLGESISLRGATGIAIVVVGMWAVHWGAAPGLEQRTGWHRFTAPGTGFAYLTLAASVGYSLFDKAAMVRLGTLPWRAWVPPAVVYYLLLGTSATFVFGPLAVRRLTLADFATVARSEWPTALAASLVSFAGYALILDALRTAPVSYVVTARQTSVLFAVALGALWLHERPSRLRVLGALATVAGVALVAG